MRSNILGAPQRAREIELEKIEIERNGVINVVGPEEGMLATQF